MSRHLSLAVLFVLACPPAAAADGLPLPIDASAGGVLSPDGSIRYVAAPVERQSVLIAQVADGDADGEVLGARLLAGAWTTPLVAYDGTPDGLARNGRTLVLIRPRATFPRRATAFSVFALRPQRPGRLRLREVIRLRGDFSFDALSPDGRSLFLIEYVSPKDPAKYRVRVLDLGRGRLEPKPISDPHRIQTRMNGYPYARATSADGRWVYTLYDGRHHPFVHALDTRRRSAMCIDLELSPDDVRSQRFDLAFDAAANELHVIEAGGAVAATIDARTFAVEQPGARPAAEDQAGHEESGLPWLALAALPALVGFGGLSARRRRG
jgi:hypothetical protein